ncbi:MAG: c-type cytochrome biogenesis protein CcmI [Robiginitomaculum sp.]|nr:MAG: c-type cytochrome biogenesis protein CcmI [Robiginitomaculum sp.]
MIWLIMGILVLCVLLFVARPLYVQQAPQTAPDSEVTDYLDKIAQIDAQIETAGGADDIPVLQAAKLELQRQIIKHNDADNITDTPPPALLLSSLFVIFAFAAIGLYAVVGRPDLTKAGALQTAVLSPSQALSQNATPEHENAMSLEQAVARLEQKLEQDGQDPQGWILYARSLMNLRRFDEAVSAYEKTLELTDNNPNVMEEFESAKRFINQQAGATPLPVPTPVPSGPTSQQMQDAANMSPQDRQAMINNMVSGLAEKLKANPNDPDGWVRLLRARRVMGQEAEANADIALMRETFKQNPQTIERILSASGWPTNK